MNLLEMNHIKKEFDGLEVIKDISVSVREGEILSIIVPPAPENPLSCAAPLCWKRLMEERSCIWERKPPTWERTENRFIPRDRTPKESGLILDWSFRILIFFPTILC